ncbi:ATP-dependent helicase [Methylobacterium aerolatum]|uniref:DNA 3'-5' helicase n=1 Tax=Methylobacterium aerolatum TaxID=418708 RepID=A0ABU0HX60_9HYPH|nr:UvrD-helicase domain-containing protein [Methylobacterium aerolatum]MDQ0446290.1 DNA helicase-2/ATP-dependent DNA helicase PcrA [Methylobacterium aerolatum]GJD35633.1 DNA helicase II [Methylobacterium aerolatum]
MQNSPNALPAAEGPSASITARAMGALRRDASPYLDGLNPEQRLAVETTEGPILVLAGAGTGKTRVLTTRIAHLISTGRARPFDILAVTFTNKAAREMKHRIGALIGPAGEGMPWLGTFHAIGTKILRRHAELVGLKSDFTILGTDDQLRLMKQVLADQNIDEKRWPARALSHTIDGWKNRGLSPEQVPPGEASAFAFGKGGTLYTAYQARLATLNAVDFGDLLLLCLKLWRENPDVLENYQDRFRYILVDEYQDTNVAQYLWLRLLAQKRKNVACVGDDDQSIYGWRGAEVDNILRFEHDFPGATVVRLERNYRSTGHILAAASGLIARNESRLGKTLRTEDEPGEQVTVTGAWDSEEEARLLAESIESLQAKQHPLSEIAVLVRISAQMREIEDRFVQLGLPYRVIGGPRFYERAEIRDALAYLRITMNGSDDLAFERIINTPKRGLGDATLQQLHGYARAERVPLLTAARRLCETDELKPKVRSTLRALTESFSRWARLVESQPHSEVAQTILEESGYTAMWQKERSADAAGRLENLKEFVRSMEEFPDMAAFLEHVSLVMEASEAEGAERVSLMTLHAAKGLEFDTVFLPGWEDGLFPNQRALDESGRAGLEEERRLAHVGLTRARKRAKLSFAVNRRIHGLWSSTIPSRFIDELPPAAVDVVEAPAHFSAGASRFDRNPQPFESSYGTPGWQRAQANTGGRGFSASPGRRGSGSSGPRQIEGELIAKSTGAPSAFAVDQRVFHTKFGPGTVAGVDGNKLTVDFDKAGRKMVLDSFVQAG